MKPFRVSFVGATYVFVRTSSSNFVKAACASRFVANPRF